jgi:hypothetical protein
MSDYRRTTRECTLNRLRPELARAIRDHARQQQWDNLEADVLMCCETTAEKISTDRLDAFLHSDIDSITYLALIATPLRLIWAHSGAHTATGAASAQYKDMRLKIFRPKHTQDIAIEIYARMDGTREKAGGRMMLDSSPTAQKFCDAVMRATDILYPPEVEKPRRKWFGRW